MLQAIPNLSHFQVLMDSAVYHASPTTYPIPPSNGSRIPRLRVQEKGFLAGALFLYRRQLRCLLVYWAPRPLAGPQMRPCNVT